MPLVIAVLMDPIEHIKPAKDSTFALLLEAQSRGHQLIYLTQDDLFFFGAQVGARGRKLTVQDSLSNWYSLGEPIDTNVNTLDIILARIDPPVNRQFVYDTMWLEIAQSNGVLVLNNPQGLRDANEKLFALQFAHLCPKTFVAREIAALRRFVEQTGQCVLKPLDGMAGQSIFRSHGDDPNLNVILETLTNNGRSFTMAQEFLEAIVDGDKRILMIDGEPLPYALARIPQGKEFRGNLARGGKGVAQPLSESDKAICAEVGPELRKRGMFFVGLDVIGDRLTEINVTSPTGIREIAAQTGVNAATLFWDKAEANRR